MFKQLFSALLIAALAAAIAAGCGGSSSSDSSEGDSTSPPTTVTTSSLSKSVFVKRADAICIKGAEQVEKALAQVSKLKGKAAETAIESFGGGFAGMVNSVAGEIQELGAPQGDEAQVEAILAAMGSAVTAAREHPTKSLEALAQQFQQSDKLSGVYGLKSCVYG
jgi:ABC-type Fe3+-hydroxamate transport system substrate-binding protein